MRLVGGKRFRTFRSMLNTREKLKHGGEKIMVNKWV